MRDFTNTRVLITGASKGIGRATATMFAEQGAAVAIGYHSDSAAAGACRDSLPGGGHILVRLDLGSPGEAERAISETISGLGSLDVLVNCAAVRGHHPIATVAFDDWRQDWERILRCNLTGVADACFHAARHMMTRGAGCIVNVSSRGAFRGEPDMPAYGAAKSGLNSLTQSLALALGPHGISVSAVAPGFVQTEGTAARLAGPEGDAIRAQSPLGRVATTDEIAQAILYLAGAPFASGTILDVNGASYLRT